MFFIHRHLASGAIPQRTKRATRTTRTRDVGMIQIVTENTSIVEAHALSSEDKVMETNHCILISLEIRHTEPYCYWGIKMIPLRTF